jgi:hypothetical protein
VLLEDLPRLSRPPERYSPSLYYLLLTDSGEPECYEEAIKVDTKKKWEQGMKEEMDSLVNNQTWDLVQIACRKKDHYRINGFTS